MKATTTILLLVLTFSGCSADYTPTTNEEVIANCMEDYMDSAYYPDDMDDMDAIDYIANKAQAYCDAKYGE